jgi:hypothetical protein
VTTRRHAVRLAVLTAILVAGWPALIEAIYVSPTAVFMDMRARDTQITIGNSGEQAEEATIELKFGFPDTDSAGTPFIRFIEDPGPEFGSAADWIRPFPQRVRLEPGTQQVIRLLARPPENLPDGEYWTRMIITGRGATINLPTADSAVRVGVGLEIRLVTSVTFRKGSITTGVRIRNLVAEAEGDSLAVWAGLARTGNGAYLGTADIELVDARKTIVRRWAMPLSVHFPMRRRFAYPTGTLEPGDYWVRFRLRSERPDLPTERVLGAPTVLDSVAVRVL